MVVEEDVEVVVDAIVYHFLHPSEPIGIDGVVIGIGDVSPDPGAWYADGTETLRLDVVDDLLCGLCRLPGCFGGEPSLVAEGCHSLPGLAGLKGVSKIPSRHHALC